MQLPSLSGRCKVEEDSVVDVGFGVGGKDELLAVPVSL